MPFPDIVEFEVAREDHARLFCLWMWGHLHAPLFAVN